VAAANAAMVRLISWGNGGFIEVVWKLRFPVASRLRSRLNGDIVSQSFSGILAWQKGTALLMRAEQAHVPLVRQPSHGGDFEGGEGGADSHDLDAIGVRIFVFKPNISHMQRTDPGLFLEKRMLDCAFAGTARVAMHGSRAFFFLSHAL
jgi:hypothetical protein